MTFGLAPWGLSPWLLGAHPASAPSLATATAAQYGGLDSTAFADGSSLNAHALRALANGAQRLVSQGEPLLVLAFEADVASGIGENLGAPQGLGAPGIWDRAIGPLSVPKKSLARFAEARARVYAKTNTTVYLQICTDYQPFDPQLSLDSDRVIVCEGNDTVQSCTANGSIRLSGSEYQTIEVWVSAVADQGAIASSGTYGAPTSGTWDYDTDELGVDYIAFDGGTLNFTGGNTLAAAQAFLYFLGPNGELLTAPRQVVRSYSARGVNFQPALSGQEWRAFLVNGFDFEFRPAPTEWLIASVSIYTEDWDGGV